MGIYMRTERLSCNKILMRRIWMHNRSRRDEWTRKESSRAPLRVCIRVCGRELRVCAGALALRRTVTCRSGTLTLHKIFGSAGNSSLPTTNRDFWRPDMPLTNNNITLLVLHRPFTMKDSALFADKHTIRNFMFMIVYFIWQIQL
jgi:hypothetical protein